MRSEAWIHRCQNKRVAGGAGVSLAASDAWDSLSRSPGVTAVPPQNPACHEQISDDNFDWAFPERTSQSVLILSSGAQVFIWECILLQNGKTRFEIWCNACLLRHVLCWAGQLKYLTGLSENLGTLERNFAWWNSCPSLNVSEWKSGRTGAVICNLQLSAGKRKGGAW